VLEARVIYIIKRKKKKN